MKILLSVLSMTALLSGCASLEEAYHLDREYGLASQASFDKIVANPDYLYVAKQPEGLPGIHGEGIMDVYNKTFQENKRSADNEVIRIKFE